MLPFGVVIPTKSSMKYLPGHLENLSTWIDLAEQVVVVDSFSDDGTLNFIKEHLRHPNVNFFTHPPGLYASWNHGIRQLTTDYCYISTVGDSLTRAGAEHFVSTAARLQCDVLVSRPSFVDEAGLPCAGPEWPMDDIVKTLQVKDPCRLPSAVIVASTLTHTGGAITGSCASDLFRTNVLRQFPFPVDFGVSGDGAWSLQNAGRLTWAVTPEKVTTFRRHPPTASVEEIRNGMMHDKFASLALETVNDWLAHDAVKSPPHVVAAMKELLHWSVEHEKRRRQYNLYRKKCWPWILNPAAWQARMRRNQTRRQVFELKKRLFSSAQPNLPEPCIVRLFSPRSCSTEIEMTRTGPD